MYAYFIYVHIYIYIYIYIYMTCVCIYTHISRVNRDQGIGLNVSVKKRIVTVFIQVWSLAFGRERPLQRSTRIADVSATPSVQRARRPRPSFVSMTATGRAATRCPHLYRYRHVGGLTRVCLSAHAYRHTYMCACVFVCACVSVCVCIYIYKSGYNLSCVNPI